MTDYERELMSQGIYLIHARPELKFNEIPTEPEPKRKVSPYAKFDKFHHKKKRK